MKYIIFLFFILVHTNSYSWGFFGHKKITEWAIYNLPESLFQIYYPQKAVLIEKSVLPDILKNSDPTEYCKHYIDSEFYNLDSIWNKDWKVCLKNENCLDKGIVPYSVLITYLNLKNAFEKKDTSKIIHYTSYLSHYASDLCVPLHTTKHYDGIGNKHNGIHAIWESYLPERYFNSYDKTNIKPKYIKNIQQRIINELKESNKEVENIYLLFNKSEHKLKQNTFGFYTRKGINKEGYSNQFLDEYHLKAKVSIQKQLRKSIQFVTDLIYTAHLNTQKTTKKSKNAEFLEIKPTIKINQRSHE